MYHACVNPLRSIFTRMVAIGGLPYHNVPINVNRLGAASEVISSSENSIMGLPIYRWIGFGTIEGLAESENRAANDFPITDRVGFDCGGRLAALDAILNDYLSSVNVDEEGGESESRERGESNDDARPLATFGDQGGRESPYLHWTTNSSGQFTLKSVYNLLVSDSATLNYSRYVWWPRNPLSCSIFIWKLLMRSLPLADNLRTWQTIFPTQSIFCGAHSDRKDHIFIGCPSIQPL